MIAEHSGCVGRCKIHADELELLASAVKPHARVLEIGTLDGVTAALLAQREPDALIVSVDIFRQVTPDCWFANRQPNMRLFVGTTADLVRSSSPPRDGMGFRWWFDVAFVDGDHRYKQCFIDLCKCSELVSGPIFVHDYGVALRPGVTRAVNEFVANGEEWLIGRIAGTLVELVRR